jgi:thiamine pyrophosphokinase
VNLEGVFLLKKAIIIANGQMVKPPNLTNYITSSFIIIAADGGIRNCISLGIRPNIIIGDLDSIDDRKIGEYRDAGVRIIQYPSHKDETDLELALFHSKEIGVSEVILLGGLGARWDMTIANMLLIAHPKYKEMNIHVMDGTQELIIMRSGTQSIVHGQPGDVISLIPIAGDVTGIVTSGLYYPLNGETLQFGTARGVSNVFTQEQAQIFITQGVLLCVINRGENL